MKIETTIAASNLGISVPQLFLHLAEISRTLTFEEIWPEIDIDWIKSISQMGAHYWGSIGPKHIDASDGSPGDTPLHLISQKSKKILEKLKKHKYWGHSSISFESIQKLTRLSAQELSTSLAELRRLKFLDEKHDGGKIGKISLNTAKRKEIESVL